LFLVTGWSITSLNFGWAGRVKGIGETVFHTEHWFSELGIAGEDIKIDFIYVAS
jgi:hypothetical protein